jgi:transcriptional regulator with XRE-family HTH domain
METVIVEHPLSFPARRAIKKLGSDISLARRRRRLTQASLAERMGCSLSTVRRIEKGDPRVPIHFIARAMHIFGQISALEDLLDTEHDSIGLAIMDEQLPKRVRHSSKTKEAW